METLTLINGNNQEYSVELPKLFIMAEHINEVAIGHIHENTGLGFVKTAWGYEAQPATSEQIAKLFLTYNFKTQYNNNASVHNTILLKICRNEGFQTDHICFDCCKENHIHTRSLKPGDRLSI